MKATVLVLLLLSSFRTVFATQADDTVITIDETTAGATPFLSQVPLSVSDSAAIKSVQLALAPKPGSSTPAL